MALINCPECGKEISDKAVACPNCGCPISSEASSISTSVTTPSSNNDDGKPSTPVKREKKGKIALIIIIAVVVLASACVLGWIFLLPEMKYQKAMKLYNEDNMVLAYDEFSTIQDYKDSSELMELCVYNQGMTKFNAGDYEEAINLFRQCKNSREAIEMVDKSNCCLAEKAYSAGDYDTALSLLNNNSYSASKELIDKCNYQLAEKAFADGDYASAITLLIDNSYSESEALLKKCNVEKEKHEKSDYTFLADLEKSILRRMEINSKEQSDYAQIVGTELAYVEKYYNASFYDASLKKLAQKYISGLRKQKEALSEFYAWDYQDKWYNGLVARYEVLNELYKKYDFLKDDKDFVGEYIYKLDYWQKWLKAFKELEAMFSKQYKEDKYWRTDNQYCYFTFTNTTKYTFTNQMDVWFYSYDGNTLLDKVTVITEDIHPGDQFTIKIYTKNYNNNTYWAKEFGNSYPAIQIP